MPLKYAVAALFGDMKMINANLIPVSSLKPMKCVRPSAAIKAEQEERGIIEMFREMNKQTARDVSQVLAGVKDHECSQRN